MGGYSIGITVSDGMASDNDSVHVTVIEHIKNRSWTSINNGLENETVQFLELGLDGTLYAGTLVAGVYLSTDDSDNWIQRKNGLTILSAYCLAVSPNGNLYLGTMAGGVFYSDDKKDNWVQINEGLTELNVYSIAINNDRQVFAGTGRGFFRWG